MSQLGLFDDDSLRAARDEVMAKLREGSTCPCCGQFAKLYRRRLTATPVRALIALYRTHGREFGHMPTVAANRLRHVVHQGGYMTLAGYWDLMVEERVRREDGGRAGFWAVTRIGEEFLHRRARVPRFAETYDRQVYGLTGELVDVADCLGRKFDLRELMGWPLEESA